MGHVLHYTTLACSQTYRYAPTQNSPLSSSTPFPSSLHAADNEHLLCFPIAACWFYSHTGCRLHHCQILNPYRLCLHVICAQPHPPLPKRLSVTRHCGGTGHLWALKQQQKRHTLTDNLIPAAPSSIGGGGGGWMMVVSHTVSLNLMFQYLTYSSTYTTLF